MGALANEEGRTDEDSSPKNFTRTNLDSTSQTSGKCQIRICCDSAGNRCCNLASIAPRSSRPHVKQRGLRQASPVVAAIAKIHACRRAAPDHPGQMVGEPLRFPTYWSIDSSQAKLGLSHAPLGTMRAILQTETGRVQHASRSSL